MKSFKVLKTSQRGQSILSQGENVSDVNVQLPTEIATLLSAAPELYNALISIRDYLQSEEKQLSDLANIAIAKAEGKK